MIINKGVLIVLFGVQYQLNPILIEEQTLFLGYHFISTIIPWIFVFIF